jgi:hypothetical protein
MWRRLLLVGFIVASATGCDTLFPEFFGGKPASSDLGTTDAGALVDGGSAPHLSGTVCILADLRDYTTCRGGAVGSMRITVEETRDQGMTDANGNFDLALSSVITTATVAAIDTKGVYAPSIIPLTLTGGARNGVALPVVDLQSLSNDAYENGRTLDAQEGSLLAWAVDGAGTPIAGVTATPKTALFEGGAAGQLGSGTNTGVHGTIAILTATAGSLTVALTPPTGDALKADSFVLPIRAGAVTVSTLVLAPQ